MTQPDEARAHESYNEVEPDLIRLGLISWQGEPGCRCLLSTPLGRLVAAEIARMEARET